MGHRANLIIVTESSYELYYSHWSLSLPVDMFWGPDYAIRYIREHERRENDHWLDDVWAEGGALVDPQQKVMMLFGGESLDQDMLLLDTYLSLIQEVWEGWEVRWAYNGILEIADYVGFPRTLLESESNIPAKTEPLSLKAPTNKSQIESAGSIITKDGETRIFPLTQFVNYYLIHGEHLLQVAETEEALEHFVYADWSAIFPESGFHIDVHQKTIHYWSLFHDFHSEDMHQKILQMWPNWNVIYEKKNYQKQIVLTSGKLQFPQISQNELMRKLAELFYLGSSYDPVKNIKNVLQQIEQEAESIYIHPAVLIHTSAELSTEEKQTIFDYACQKMLQKQTSI
ncbi:hypothetical protein [Shimazuella kribbensis]|uniref:hypothetical protein n=1 Tax=Shimazuella kribbensis TaxID=139808 RepID=UPI000405B202|nr:hypothetical protein [Shimazuella kribbensis]